LSIPELWAKLHASPAAFVREFGRSGWHGIVGWAVVTPVAGVLLYFLFLPLTKELARRAGVTKP